MKWIDKISSWENGEEQTYPNNIDQPFFFETYKCDKDLQNKYKEKFIQSPKLNFKQDYSAFSKHIAKSTNKYAISFYNLSSPTI
jgi:hypothetical protein